jgi:hypothetical protein
MYIVMYLKWKGFGSSCIVTNKTIKNMDVFDEYCNKNKAIQFNLLTWFVYLVFHCIFKSSSEDEQGKNLPKYDLCLQ